VLKALNSCTQVDRVVLATDGDEIAAVVEGFALDKVSVYRRNAENASDTASTESVMLEYIGQENLQGHDLFILAQATSPFTQAKHFQEALGQLKESGADSLLSVVRQKRFFWNAGGASMNYDYRNRPRRQDFDGMLMENGAFYISTVQKIVEAKNRLSGKISCYEMPEYTGLELDEEVDWTMGEVLMAQYHPEEKEPDYSKIKLVLSDVDGVLTDAGMYYSELGDELKKFCTYDGMAFRLMQEQGIKVGIVTAEDRALNRRRADKLKLDFQFHGVKNKLVLVEELIGKLGVRWDEVAYVGDDLNDVEVLSRVGFPVCPANAQRKVLKVPGVLKMKSSGGGGVIRELYNLLFDKG
jgi:N-acylneuraminate cytidylyltransferase